MEIHYTKRHCSNCWSIVEGFVSLEVLHFMFKGCELHVGFINYYVERVGIIIAVAFILTRFRFFKDLIAHDQLNGKQVISAILFFGFFGIIGTYLGVALN